ncbi:MAG: YebC/PmpR family DNA-binding transcriptional regulator [Candidatus Omnitrophica bacterium]|nr:YebC/PmpR family DNA-binding transcriptional regulator [Candidatus Omnitrophota bacterium]
MSGHSKWASIKHKKALLDAKKGQAYTKMIREITAAARDGGGNPDKNPALRTAISRAKELNMPSDNVKNAIKRGTGELPGVSYETILYEGYGPFGVAIMVEAVTDNKNRTTAELRNIFSKKGGSLAGTGSVSWIFSQKGYILVSKAQIKEEQLLNLTIEAGAEDIKSDNGNFEVTTSPADFENVKKAIKEKGLNFDVAELGMIPSSTIKITNKEKAKQILTLVEALEEHDDAQHVYANFDIPDEFLQETPSS